jgi:hypothetical protein
LSTRLFSPKPGHRKRPSPPRRNQLTKKIFGSFEESAFLPRSVQRELARIDQVFILKEILFVAF